MWVSCKKPPLPFLRVEIKDINERMYLGFYAGFGCWLETDGHEVIKNPNVWRHIKSDSILEKEFKYKISQRALVKECGD